MTTKINSLLLSLFARMQIVREEAGQAMVEYTLIVALISVVAVATIGLVGVKIGAAWTTVEEKF